jgi:predicted alpha/beta-fold hydrolase
MSGSNFNPPLGIGGPNAQTILGSTVRKYFAVRRAAELKSVEQPRTLQAEDGAKLVAWISEQPKPAPLVIVIHGWLGTHNSGYNLSLSQRLWQDGFSVARLNLRDHGGTAHLNEGMFHNGLIDEVVDVVGQLQKQYGGSAVVGFSLGGNFALRLAKHLSIPALGICPLMDPATSVALIDRSANVYKGYFMRKWNKAMVEKSTAFPAIYDFKDAAQFKTVHSMTEHFVDRYTQYETLQSYYDCYTLTGNYLDGLNVAILAAADDPVVPGDGFVGLPDSVKLTLMPRGGHCAFVDSFRMTSFADDFASNHLHSALRS